MTHNFYPINLQLFAEGAGNGASGVTGSAAESNSGVTDLGDVRYGIDPDEKPAAEVTNATPIDRDSEFEKLIKGDYKEQYNARVQKTVQDRLKNSKSFEDKYNSLQPTLEILAKKYGVDIADIDALNKAIEDDDTYFEDEAFEKGVTVDELKRIRKIEKENADLKRQMDERASQEGAAKIYSAWMSQADETKQIYGAFDFEAEMQNPEFVSLLQANIPVRTAYEVIHKDDIISGAMQFAANTIEQKVAKSVAANRARPSENGLSRQAASTVRKDVNSLTDADLAEVHKRVARGERITFG